MTDASTFISSSPRASIRPADIPAKAARLNRTNPAEAAKLAANYIGHISPELALTLLRDLMRTRDPDAKTAEVLARRLLDSRPKKNIMVSLASQARSKSLDTVVDILSGN